jgi:hypothetical protein
VVLWASLPGRKYLGAGARVAPHSRARLVALSGGSRGSVGMLRQTTRALAGVTGRASPASTPAALGVAGARSIGKVGVPENYGQIDGVGTKFLGTPANHREVGALTSGERDATRARGESRAARGVGRRRRRAPPPRAPPSGWLQP